MFVPTTADLVLDENNVTTISKISSKKVLLKYKPSNGWNTICMPFGVSSYMNTIFGAGWKAFSLSSYDDVNHTLTFERANYPTTNPYLIYIESAPNYPNGVELSGVSIYSDNPLPSSTTRSGATFQGTYAPIAAPGMDGMYGVTTAGKLGKGSDKASIKGYRAYFNLPAGARPTIVFDDEEGGTTDLGFVKMVDPEAKDVYTLSGQKVEKAGKGIYSVSGHKVVIK